MSIYVLANWKAHKTMPEATVWLETFCRLYHPRPGLQVIIAPPIPYLIPLAQQLRQCDNNGLALAAQDLSPFPLGAYTGAVAAAMVSDVVDYAILGHIERRRYFHETNQDVANKATEATAAGIRPIVCINRPHARSQVAALSDESLKDLMIGYRPLEAIGIDVPETPAEATEVVQQISEIVPDKPILYGGSLNSKNAAAYLKIDGVAGLMVGRASLDAEEFARICNIAKDGLV
jgi:triosephosphate isomerase